MVRLLLLRCVVSTNTIESDASRMARARALVVITTGRQVLFSALPVRCCLLTAAPPFEAREASVSPASLLLIISTRSPPPRPFFAYILVCRLRFGVKSLAPSCAVPSDR